MMILVVMMILQVKKKLYQFKKKKVKFEEKKENLETIIESPVNYHSDSGMLYKRPHDIFGRPIKRF